MANDIGPSCKKRSATVPPPLSVPPHQKNPDSWVREKGPFGKSVSRRGGCNKGGRKQMRANANKRRQTSDKRRGENAEAKTQANASKRGQTQTNAYTPLYCGFLHPPLQSPKKRGLFRKVPFIQEILESEFRDTRYAREPPDSGKQRGIRPFFCDPRDLSEFRYSRDSSSEKDPLS